MDSILNPTMHVLLLILPQGKLRLRRGCEVANISTADQLCQGCHLICALIPIHRWG